MSDILADSPIIIRDDRIAFNTNISRHDKTFYQIDPHQLFTKYGYLVPLNTSSFELLDYFHDGLSLLALGGRKAKCLMIDCHARVHEIVLIANDDKDEQVMLSRMRVLTGVGTRYATASIDAEIEKAQVALMATDTLEDTLKVLIPCLYEIPAEYQIFDIPYIASRLKRRGECDPFPVLKNKLNSIDTLDFGSV